MGDSSTSKQISSRLLVLFAGERMIAANKRFQAIADPGPAQPEA